MHHHHRWHKRSVGRLSKTVDKLLKSLASPEIPKKTYPRNLLAEDTLESQTVKRQPEHNSGLQIFSSNSEFYQEIYFWFPQLSAPYKSRWFHTSSFRAPVKANVLSPLIKTVHHGCIADQVSVHLLIIRVDNRQIPKCFHSTECQIIDGDVKLRDLMTAQ